MNFIQTFLSSMRSSENMSFLGILALAFFVLSSKHIIIYNEETLVLLSFFCFLVFCYTNLNESVESSLNARSDAIQTELQNFLILKENLINELIEEHKKQISSSQILENLAQFSQNEIGQIQKLRESALQSLWIDLIHQKLHILSEFGNQGPFAQKFQYAIAASFRSAIQEAFQRQANELSPKLIQQAVAGLSGNLK
jgi:Ca2+/Na+ antiporter